MPIDFKLPELGENITSGDIVNVLVREGDLIAANDGVVELETDKAVVEIPCPHAGKIAKVHVKKGESVKVGQVLVSVEAEAQVATPAAPSKSVPKENAPVAPPEAAKESDKPSPPAPLRAPTEGWSGEGSIETPPSASQPSTAPIPAGPVARRMARELGIDLQRVSGSGQRGRITPEDVKTAASKETGATAAPERVVPPGEPGQDNWGAVSREKMTKIRRVIAAQMTKSATIIPHVTNFDDADITNLEQLRKNVPQDYLGPGVKLTTLSFVVRAVGLSLLRHPTLNASLDDEKEEIVYKHYVNLGIAVDTPRGLVVPVLRGADRISIPQIAKELSTLSGKARDASFTLEEIRGGSFTISNMGAVGGAYSTPIVNHPEVAILLLGRARWMLASRDEKIENRFLLPLSLSYDHRLVDGAAAARFLNEVIAFLQNPGKLLLAM
ncbi:MAG: 2-oxo acid dehydrogenase subunit E2 [Pirellulales bacterium]|nr:2-oxo acid dehydrogenase subunit E2 [Pirellulales bacterium]